MYLNGTGFGNINITATVSGDGRTLISGTYLPVTINPASFTSVSGITASEIVWVYSYSANASQASIIRAQEGTVIPAGGAWATGTVWGHGPTSADFGISNQLANGDYPAPTASGQIATSVGSGQSTSFVWSTPTVPTNTILTSPIETATIISTGASGTLTYDIITSSVRYRTVAASGNITLNIRGSATVPFGTIVGSGQSITAVQLITNGTTPYYINTLQIDGVTQTPKWQGGTGAPTAGNPNAVDVYSYTIICTTSGNYTVLGSTNKFV
jgi:hypothetical protein